MTEDQGSTGGPAHIEANYGACMGSGLCAYIAAENFDVIDGTVKVLDPNVTEANRSAIEEAVESCPTQPLSIVSGPS